MVGVALASNWYTRRPGAHPEVALLVATHETQWKNGPSHTDGAVRHALVVIMDRISTIGCGQTEAEVVVLPSRNNRSGFGILSDKITTTQSGFLPLGASCMRD